MANTLAILTRNCKTMGREEQYDFSVTLSGSYAVGGEVLDFSLLPLIKTSRAPMAIWPVSFVSGGILIPEFTLGTTNKNSLMRLYTAFGAEATGAYSAPQLATVIKLRAVFLKNI